MTFPYPGDDLAALMSINEGITTAYTNVSLLASDVSQAQSQLAGAWTGDAAAGAQGDVGQLATALPDMAKRLNDAATAVLNYENTLNGIQIQIDDLRSQYAKLSSILTGDNEAIGRADRFGEANDMTPTQISDYRTTLQGDANKTQGQLNELVTEYNAQVAKANDATNTCRTALTASYTVTRYEGSTLSSESLADGFGLGSLQVAHFVAMQLAAKQFEADIKGINNTGQDPADREKRIDALLAKYGSDVTDPVFATTVAKDEGPNYFRQLEVDISNYFGSHQSPDERAIDRSFYVLNAQILATATNFTNPQHVDQSYLDDLFTDGHGNVEPWAITGGMSYLNVGVPFPTAYLDTMGKDTISYESDHLNAAGYLEPPWQYWQSGRFAGVWGAAPFDGTIAGDNDPLAAIMKQYADHPDSSSQLFTDHGGPNGEGDLYYLTHRQWLDGSGSTAFGNALVAESGPMSGDLTKAAAIATETVHDVAQDTDNVPSQLHDAVGRVVARYMGDVINAESVADGGLPGANSATQLSGLDEGAVGHANFNLQDLSSALKFAYSDTGNQTVRNVLTDAWTKTSHQDMAMALQTATNELNHDPGNYSSSVVFNTAGAANKTLGLLTGSDISGFNSAQEKAEEAAAQRAEILKTLASFVPVPEVEGLGHIASTMYDSSADFIKDTVTSALAGTPSGDAAGHADQTTFAGFRTVDGTSASIVTTMSKMGLPVIYSPDDSALRQVTTVFPSATHPDASLFTDPTTHQLLSLSQIEQKGPAAEAAFQRWFTTASFTGGDTSASSLQAGQTDPFLAGLAEAAH